MCVCVHVCVWAAFHSGQVQSYLFIYLYFFLKNAKNASSLPKLISFHDWVIDVKSASPAKAAKFETAQFGWLIAKITD